MTEKIQPYKCCIYKNATVRTSRNPYTGNYDNVNIPYHVAFYKKYYLTAYLFPSTRNKLHRDDDVIQLMANYGHYTNDLITPSEYIEEDGDNVTEFICFDKFTEKYADDYMDETGQYYQLHERSDIKYGNWVD